MKKEDDLGRELPAVSSFNAGQRLKKSKSGKPTNKKR